MAKTDFKSADDYLATLSEDDRKAVRSICATPSGRRFRRPRK